MMMCNSYTVRLFDGKQICPHSFAENGFTSRECSARPVVALAWGPRSAQITRQTQYPSSTMGVRL